MIFNRQDYFGITPLMVAAARPRAQIDLISTALKECFESIEIILRDRLIDINKQDIFGRTALMHVVLRLYFYSNSNKPGKEAVTKLLLKHGADPFVTDVLGKSAFDYFLEYCGEDHPAYRLLLEKSNALSCESAVQTYSPISMGFFRISYQSLSTHTKLLNYVAEATPDKTDPTLIKTEAEALLKAATPADRQALLRTPGVFTDYSGRTFNCTAFEYAYWAKDIYMCKMLLSYMDDETKAQILSLIIANDAAGLGFQQNGTEHRSSHFDLEPLKAALQVYVDGYYEWKAAKNWTTIDTAWLDVGKAQCELPVHVVNEYCRIDRSFFPTPSFNDPTLPRALEFFNYRTYQPELLFPLTVSESDLGSHFALSRAMRGSGEGLREVEHDQANRDLTAVKCLDEVRTVDLTRLREDLNPPASTPHLRG